MTTATATEVKNNEAPFSYAAAASGKSKPKSAGTENSRTTDTAKPVDTKKDNGLPDVAKLSINGESPATSTKNENSTQTNGAVSEDMNLSTSTTAHPSETQSQGETAKDEDGRSTTSAQDVSEGGTGNEEGDESNEKEGPDEKAKFKAYNLIDAPIPKQNPWTARKEAFDRTKALNVDPIKRVQPTMNGAGSNDRGSQTSTDKKHNRQKSGIDSAGKSAQFSSGFRPSGSEKRGQTDAIKENKSGASGEEGTRSSRSAGRNTKTAQEGAASRDSSSQPAPPSLADKAMWPTPEVAQDEEKREKREKEEKEKEKPAASAPRPTKDKWIAMAVTPNIIYNTPLPTRGNRGSRGGRTERGGRSGQPSSRPTGDSDATATTTEQSSVPNLEKTKASQPSSSGAGAAMEARARRPAGSTAAQTENTAEHVSRKEQAEARRDLNQPSNSSKLNGITSNEAAKDSKSPQAQDDGAFVGQGVLPPAFRPKNDKPTTFHQNRDQNHHARGSFSSSYMHKQEGEAPHVSHQTRERAGSRGGYRGGRGDSSNSFYNPTARYSTNNSIRHHSPPSQINTNQHQQPRSSPQYPSSPSTPQTRNYSRGGGRAHGHQQQQQPQIKYGVHNGFPPQSPYAQSPGFQQHPYYSGGMNGINPSAAQHVDFEFISSVQNVVSQLGYYFSLDNLVKDTYLRSHMDSQGWIFIDVIAGFRKVKDMTKDNINIVREAAVQCQLVEFRHHPDGRERMRPVTNPTSWVLKYEDRDESCRHEGPSWDLRFGMAGQFMQQPPHPYPVFFQNPNIPTMPTNGPGDQQAFQQYGMYAHQGHPLPGFVPGQEFVPENGPVFGNGYPSQFPTFVPAGHEAPQTNGHTTVEEASLQNEHNKGVRSHKKYPTIDEFTDDKVKNLVLVTRVLNSGTTNGTQDNTAPEIGSVLINEQLNEALVKLEQSNAQGGPESNKPKDTEEHLVKYYPSSPRLGPAPAPQKQQHDEVGWFIDPGVSKEASRVPGTTAFKFHPYLEFKNNVLSRRQSDGPSQVPELDTLYRFYSHFLRKHFNLNMYNEFKSLALEDFAKNSGTGIEYLYKFHVFKIHDFPTPDLIFQDFASLASDQPPPYGKDKVDAVGHSKSMSSSTKTRLAKFMQEKIKNFQGWEIPRHRDHFHGHHGHHGGAHNNHAHGNSHNHNHGHNHNHAHGNHHNQLANGTIRT